MPSSVHAQKLDFRHQSRREPAIGLSSALQADRGFSDNEFVHLLAERGRAVVAEADTDASDIDRWCPLAHRKKQPADPAFISTRKRAGRWVRG